MAAPPESASGSDVLGDWPSLGAGRGVAGRALLGWAGRGDAPRLCVVGGARGAGKSHLLAWFAAHGAGHAAVRVNAVVPAAGLTPTAVLWELARQLDWDARTLPELLARAAGDRRPLLIGFADLHRAEAREHRTGFRLVPELVEPLLRQPWVRVVAEVGSVAASEFSREATVIDLDDPRFTDPEGYADWYAGLAPGGPPPVPADVPYPHPVLGRLAAGLSAAPAAGEGIDRAIPGAWWESQDGAVRRGLGTLARLRGRVDLEVWRAVHAAAHREDADVSAAAGVLGAGPFHLASPALVERALAETELDVFDALLSLVPTNARGIANWADAPRYVRDHIAGHAATEDAAARLLSDPGFLVHGSVSDIAGLLDRPGLPAPPALRAVWRAVGPALALAGEGLAERAAILHAGALARAPRLAGLLAPAAEGHPVLARWSRVRRRVTVASGPAKGERWPGAVRALALDVPSADAPPRLVAADPLGQLRRLDVATGAPEGRIVHDARAPVAGLVALGGGAWAVLSDGGTVRLVGSGGEAPTPVPFDVLNAGQRAVSCLGGDPAGRLLVCGDESGRVTVYERGARQWSVRLAEVPVTAVDCLRLGNGRVLVVGAVADGRVLLWGPPEAPSSVPLLGRASVPMALVAAHTSLGAVVAVSWANGLVELLGLPGDGALSFRPHHEVTALALSFDGLLVGAGDDAVTAWRCDLSRLVEPAGAGRS
ncbi:WD40 repeat domain-containing protein [Streptomyces profundus]|uniref:WD40 repeat domain-containing protein n=1 Tax=Streptomyces profundus TaxID=2867410 RepID=UPI001D167992|nr:WD40 repeat domain-containing protein [Streptomyces sp. MA3_2.13]UED87372.1 WD40 repeat domain-containing protein [Streptomyces sp. MA3_2.13]